MCYDYVNALFPLSVGEVVILGHGPEGTKKSVESLKQYLVWLWAEAKPRFDSRMSWNDAASEVVIDHLPHWIDGERVFINVASLWHEFSEGEFVKRQGRFTLPWGHGIGRYRVGMTILDARIEED